MHAFAHLRLLANRKDFNSAELRLCGLRWPGSRLIESAEDAEVRKLLGLEHRQTDAFVLTSLLALRTVEPVLQQAGIPPMDAYPTVFSFPPVAQVHGAKLEANGAGYPRALGPADVFPGPELVELTRVNDGEASLSVSGYPTSIIRARLANGVLTVDWPDWLRVRGVLVMAIPWEGSAQVVIRFAATEVPLASLSRLLERSPAVRILLREADLTDLHFGAAASVYKVGFVVAALVTSTYKRNIAALT